jgi:hypothetical protein
MCGGLLITSTKIVTDEYYTNITFVFDKEGIEMPISAECVGKWSGVVAINNSQIFPFYFSSVYDDYAYGYIRLMDIKEAFCQNSHTDMTKDKNILQHCNNSWVKLTLRDNQQFWFYLVNPYYSYLYGAINSDQFKEIGCPRPSAPPTQALNVAGTWNSSYGKMTLSQRGTNVT